ncbi:MAG TPA: DUF1587 domain-containing protein, partial [Polyangia bacterium]|nr:DUF1587 domain-containing protein [Polyangia bacterium]
MTAAAACLSLTLACTGQIGGSAGGPGPAPVTGGGGGGTTVTTPLTCSDRVTDIDVTPLRRLTNAEYVNTVSDLLGDVTSLNLAFA